jgi:DNA-binding CsgD family transcriptional regulator
MRALFAAFWVELALARGDDDGVTAWTGPEILGVATHGIELRPATAAVRACVQALGGAPAGSLHAAALRRALLRCDPGEAAELLSLAARFGNAEDAGFAVERLRATFAPERPYVKAHYLLARAHWCSRFGKRVDAVDSAGDAARAFDAIGLRRWTDESMSLLVHDDAPDGIPQRRRPTAFSLTGREQQVAHLIRRGASNREVARTLQISEHTVERHVSSILSRLGLRSRWQIVDLKAAADDASP